MRRLFALCLTLLAAACGSGDDVDFGGDCSGGKRCKEGLVCSEETQRCVLAGSLVDARPADARTADARVTDGGGGTTADASTLDGGGTALDTTITSGPSGTINVNTATFNFTCTTPPCTFECALDTGNFASCTSPNTVGSLAAGAHTYRVRASAGGQTDPTPATASFTVNLAGLATVITENPANPTNQTTATFRFECRLDGTVQNDCTFSCNLDGTAAACTSPRTINGLSATAHTFTVTATRGAQTGTPATFPWTIDTTPPTVNITSGPTGGQVTGPNATFTYQPSETAAAFVCTLDAAPVDCGPDSKQFTGLGGGAHTFTVLVRDLAGNPSAPASATFTVDNTGPTVEVTSPGATSGPSGALVFTATDQSEPVTSTCNFGAGAVPCTSPFNFNALPAGPATVTIVSTDSFGNATTTVHTFTVVVNGPVVQILSPAEGSAVCTSGVNLNFDTVPATAQVTYSCTNNGEPFACVEGGMDLAAVLQGGPNTIVVNATDSLNLTGSATVTVFVDNSRPQVLIVTPTVDQVVCPSGTITYATTDTGVRGPIDIVECSIRTPAGTTIACSAVNGVVTYSGRADGLHTITLRAQDSCGNMTEPAASRRFDVDAVGPTLENLVATPGAENSGAATVTFTRNNNGDPATNPTTIGALALATPGGGAPLVVPCTCGPTSCSCTNLAAGTNAIGIRGVDQCLNQGPIAGTTVGATFGPYAGHKVAIAHSYEEAETDAQPEDILGNAVSLPYVVRDAASTRAPRVLAFVTAAVTPTMRTRAQRAIASQVSVQGATWTATPVLYTEFDDPAELETLIAGRDVLLVYDGDGEVDLTEIGFTWNDDAGPLFPFLDAGGVAVGLADGVATLYPFQIGAKPRAAARPQSAEGVYKSYITTFPEDFFIAQGVSDAPYAIPEGNICAGTTNDLGPVSVVFDSITQPEGFSVCEAVTDQVFPRYEILLSGDPTPTLTCFGLTFGNQFGANVHNGLITIDLTGPETRQPPRSKFTCQAGPSSGDPLPRTVCATDGSSFSGTFEDGWRVDIHLVEPDGVDVAQAGYNFVTIDPAVTFNNLFAFLGEPCVDRYTVVELDPSNCSSGALNERVWRSVTCTLSKSGVPGVLETRTGTQCGATPAQNPADGFITQGNITSDWTTVAEANGAGTYFVSYTVDDWRGNQATGFRAFTIDANELCDPTIITKPQ